MRLIDADALIGKDVGIAWVSTEAIEKAPTIEAEPVKHGRWVNVQNGKGCCSECNRLDAIDPIATHCRYCGAKMIAE